MSDKRESETGSPVFNELYDEFPPLPEATEIDIDGDLEPEEKQHYLKKFQDLHAVVKYKLHCTACDRHLGSSLNNQPRLKCHPMLRTLICQTCYKFYNSGDFDRGEDGSELYCRWCGQGGQVYCCSDCIHVFCAKCIKRNMGLAKIKEIEDTDDWKCFKCAPQCLWDARALCWALLRYCKVREDLIGKTLDIEIKNKYLKLSFKDFAECCKDRRTTKRNSAALIKEYEYNKLKDESDKKKDESNMKKDESDKKTDEFGKKKDKCDKKNYEIDQNKNESDKRKCETKSGFLQVKSFASTSNNLDSVRNGSKESSPKVDNMIRIAPSSFTTRNSSEPETKKLKKTETAIVTSNNKVQKFVTYTSQWPRSSLQDTMNSSLGSLARGVNSASHINNFMVVPQNDVVCTPDIPAFPQIQAIEENYNHVESINPRIQSTIGNIPKSNTTKKANDKSTRTIIQMSEDEVSINPLTGGLKFRVDPRTLSSKKMYRLPDGRVFAINMNPNMPGGYSATIVSLTEEDNITGPPTNSRINNAPPRMNIMPETNINNTGRRHQPTPMGKKSSKTRELKSNLGIDEFKKCDLQVPVEWYRYNLTDAMDILQTSLTRLKKLNNQTTTMFLRSRTVNEMRGLHKTLDRILNHSSIKFRNVRNTLTEGFNSYLTKKHSTTDTTTISEEDDDNDVEIIPNDDGPIYIDENSNESIHNAQEKPDNQEDVNTGVSNQYEEAMVVPDDMEEYQHRSLTDPLSHNDCLNDQSQSAIDSNDMSKNNEDASSDQTNVSAKQSEESISSDNVSQNNLIEKANSNNESIDDKNNTDTREISPEKDVELTESDTNRSRVEEKAETDQKAPEYGPNTLKDKEKEGGTSKNHDIDMNGDPINELFSEDIIDSVVLEDAMDSE